ncbi:MAG: DNA recombination protein RmuC [Oscillospiraceae bacterium]|nr:DNA recombination protein RmuC [Oscillospiraceae bacterium]
MEIATLILAALACLFSLLALLRRPEPGLTGEDLEKVRQDLMAEIRLTRQELNATLTQGAQQQAETQRRAADRQDSHLQQAAQQLAAQQAAGQKATLAQLTLMAQQLQADSALQEQQLQNIRQSVESRLTSLQADNNQKLTEMRQTVDQQLQKTLNETLNRSFSQVSRQLEQVYRGLGEMQTLAAGVGDLKKVLSNVKTRGILGEVQLGAILQELLTPDQYAENIATRPGSTLRVEFALKLPGSGDQPVWLPIDAKFPADAYEDLLNAYDEADPARVEAAAKELEHRVRGFAKDIHDKYIAPPNTTDFGVMFLPVEGLYAEVVRRGVSQRIQQEFKVIVAGPTTMSALLNSLQMGFRTLAIQKRSGEVWRVLGRVRAEFDTFGRALGQTQARLNQASAELENLVGVRTRQIQRRLDEVSRLSPEEELPPAE